MNRFGQPAFIASVVLGTALFFNPRGAWSDTSIPGVRGQRPSTDSDSVESPPAKSTTGTDRERSTVPLAGGAATELRLLWLIDTWMVQQQLTQQADRLEAWVYLRGTKSMVQDLESVRAQLLDLERWLMFELAGQTPPDLRLAQTSAKQVSQLLSESQFRLMMLEEMARLDLPPGD